jgi:phosphatidylglycerol:prolipoprotein diacylglycerol transferase
MDRNPRRMRIEFAAMERPGETGRRATALRAATGNVRGTPLRDVGTTLWLALFALLFLALVARNFVLGSSEIGIVRVGPIVLAPFGPLVSLGVLFGIHLMRVWAQRFALAWEDVFAAVGWMLVVGFVGSHVLDVALYRPQQLFEPGVLLDFRSDYSSFGGFVCGGVTAAIAFRRYGVPLLRGMECTLYGFIGGWLFGRLACFSVHDHPGRETTFPLGVPMGGVVRHDLGLYELLYTIGLFAVVQGGARSRRPDGWVVAVAATSYAPVRFALDFLRVRDATYAGLTPAQWACIPLFVLGIVFVARVRAARS